MRLRVNREILLRLCHVVVVRRPCLERVRAKCQRPTSSVLIRPLLIVKRGAVFDPFPKKTKMMKPEVAPKNGLCQKRRIDADNSGPNKQQQPGSGERPRAEKPEESTSDSEIISNNRAGAGPEHQSKAKSMAEPRPDLREKTQSSESDSDYDSETDSSIETSERGS